MPRARCTLWISLALVGAGLATTGHAAPPAPVTVTAARLDVEHAKQTARFSGQVKVTQTQAGGNFVLEADTVEIRYGAEGQSGAIRQLVAQGNVVMSKPGTPPEMATGDKAVYTPAQGGQAGQVVLTGPSVSLSRGPSRLTGDKLVYSLSTQQATVTNSQGSVKATFVPE